MVALAVLAILAIGTMRRSDSLASIRACLPWLAFIAYALSASLTIASSRAGFGFIQATSSRYVAIAIFLYIGLAGGSAVLLDRRAIRRVNLVVALASIYLVVGIAAGHAGVRTWTHWIDERDRVGREVRAGDDREAARLYPDVSQLKVLIREACDVADSPVGCALATARAAR